MGRDAARGAGGKAARAQDAWDALPGREAARGAGRKVLAAASVASMIDQFCMPDIRLMQEMGYEVHVACNFRQGNTCDAARVRKLRRTLGEMGAVPHQWDCPRNIRDVRKCWGAYRQLLHLAGREQFAWMHCHSPVGGALARAVAHRQGIRVIYTAHGFHFYKGAPLKNWLLYYPAEKLLAHWTDVLVTVNREDYLSAKRNLKAGRIFHIPGIGIDMSRFRASGCPLQGGVSIREEIRSKYRIPDGALLLLSVGELSRRKNHQAVLHALAELPRQDVYYLVCGQGKWKKRLIRKAEMLGIADRVRLPGFCEDVAAVYQAADLFVFPSLQEGLPAALMEAMAAGLACVVSDIRGNRELIDDGRQHAAGKNAARPGGIRFSLRQPKQLAEALRLLLEDETLRREYGRHNQEKIRGYDLTMVNRRMKKIYHCMEKEE